jgi:hypothetical protein
MRTACRQAHRKRKQAGEQGQEQNTRRKEERKVESEKQRNKEYRKETRIFLSIFVFNVHAQKGRSKQSTARGDIVKIPFFFFKFISEIFQIFQARWKLIFTPEEKKFISGDFYTTKHELRLFKKKKKKTNPSGTVGWPVSKSAEPLKCPVRPLAVQSARPCEAAEAHGTRKPLRMATSAAAE